MTSAVYYCPHKYCTQYEYLCIIFPVFVFSQFRVFTAPFHRVEFADFWLADQLNSLVIVLSDLEYLVCYYSMELQWGDRSGLLPSTYGN